jgi:hypothetical protein
MSCYPPGENPINMRRPSDIGSVDQLYVKPEMSLLWAAKSPQNRPIAGHARRTVRGKMNPRA